MMKRLIAAFVCMLGAGDHMACHAIDENLASKSSDASTEESSLAQWATIDPAQFYPPGLARPFPRDLVKVPLSDLATELARIADLRVRVDRTFLNEAGVEATAPITCTAKGTPIHSLLDRILRDVEGVELTWFIENDGLVITTSDKAETVHIVRTIDIAPLLNAGYQAAQINRMVLSLTPGPWTEVDGDGGTLRIIGDHLSVRQTFRQLTEVLCLLAALQSPEPTVAIGKTPADEKAHAALAQRVTIQVAKTPLRDVMGEFARQTGVAFEFDQIALQEAGISSKEEVSVDADRRPLKFVLDELFENVGGTELAAHIDSGVINISTRDQCDTVQSIRLYNIKEMAARDESEDFVEMLLAVTEGPWAQVDGDGGVIELPRPDTLVVRQTEHGLREVDALVAKYRKGTPRPRQAPEAIEVRRYRLPAQMAEDLVTTIPKFVAVDKWKDFPDGTSPLIERVSLGNHRAANDVPIVVTLEDDGLQKTKEGDGINATIRSGSAVLIIRQTHAVHRQIQRFIKDLTNTPEERVPGLGAGLGKDAFGSLGCFGFFP